MRFSIQRYGTGRNEVAITTEEKRGNEFFQWLATLDEGKHGSVGMLPTGFPCRYVAHDVFGERDAYLRDEGQWYYLPPTQEDFKGIAYWIASQGRRVFFSLHFGERGESALLFEATPLQLALPPVGIRIDGEPEGVILPCARQVGAAKAEKIDGLLSDERSHCHIRILSTTEKTQGQDGAVQEREWIKVEIGIPRLTHLAIINPPNDAFALMFGNS
jgi:hypothetical protein